MSEIKQTVEVLKESVDRLARELATKKMQFKLAKEQRDDFLESQVGFKPIQKEYKESKLRQDIYKGKLETDSEVYRDLVNKTKDASLEVKVLEQTISQQLVEYALQKGESVIPNGSGEKVNFKIKCLFSAKQLKLFE